MSTDTKLDIAQQISPPSDVRSQYRTFGWQVDEDDATGTTHLVIGDPVGAVLMPTDLAEQVHGVLQIHMLSGPVISYREQWALLTEPGAPDDLPADMAAWNVIGIPAGQRLTLPPPGPALGGVHWINTPAPDGRRPPWQAVVSATRRVMTHVVSHSA